MENLKVLVTGAGGSIGSALCKALKVRELVLYEHSEYALYKINEELTCNRLAVLGDIKDTERLSKFMDGVDVVFHCAAYKHVPIVEANVQQGLRNNVFGTYNVAMASQEVGVETCVLISTDKAVRPTNIMGASKRLAEMLLQSHEGEVSLLPALPSAWPSGRASGLRARGGYEVDLVWSGGRLVGATVWPSQAGPCRVRRR